MDWGISHTGTDWRMSLTGADSGIFLTGEDRLVGLLASPCITLTMQNKELTETEGLNAEQKE